VDVNVKPITQDPIDPQHYKKGAYLKPFKHQRSGSEVEGSLHNEGDQLGLQPQIHRRFLSINQQQTISPGTTVNNSFPKTTTNSFIVEK